MVYIVNSFLYLQISTMSFFFFHYESKVEYSMSFYESNGEVDNVLEFFM